MFASSFSCIANRGIVSGVVMLLAAQVAAGPVIQAGDLALRHDIQRLADAGIITGPVTSWPLAWAPIVADIRNIDDPSAFPADARQALLRVRVRADRAMKVGEAQWRARAAAAADPSRMRGYQYTPREDGELSADFSWHNERFTVDLQASVVADPSDGNDLRADGSQIGIALGNFTVAASTLDRWWGPGWDGSLILSNNARPMAALSIDRTLTGAFNSKWLSWLGPWDLVAHFGRFESARQIPNARFFGMRFNFKPFPSLEIGLSRTAQWCGEGRPCGLDTFFDLLLGRDNIGDDGIDTSNEPGNQLAGIDVRWSGRLFGQPLALYGQMIGEDEAGGYPSKFLGQLGLETSGSLGTLWSYRWFAEIAATTCQFYKSTEFFNCAYNHTIYATGYRYRGRAVGHTADNDARIISSGLILLDDQNTQWSVLMRYGALNRGGSPDSYHSLTPTRQDVASIDVTHSRLFAYGQLEIGVGYERSDDALSGNTSNDGRAFLQWRSAH